MIRRTLVAAATAAVTLSPAAPAVTQVQDDPGRPPTARALLEQAATATESLALEGRVAIVTFDSAGPSVSEIEVVRGRSGQLRMGQGASWMVGRSGEDAFLWEPDGGRLLRFGGVDPVPFSVGRLMDNYDMTVAGTRDLGTGPATVLAAREHGAARDREHLYVDDATGMIVRRDTFQADGRPARVVAFTDLDVEAEAAAAPPMPSADDPMQPQSLDTGQLRVLESVGWVAPRSLPGGYRLRSSHALPDPDTGSLHLVYSDGLYTLSLYEQHGRLRSDALDGAATISEGEVRVHRWPGAQPARIVWSGDGLVFTVITDAPYDHALRVAAALPRDPPPPLVRRLLDGVERGAERLWPFD